MKVHVLMENTACSPDYISQHGLSLLIETQGTKILFDTGQNGGFAENADRMGLRLEDTDFAFISHGHYDHGGGIESFLSLVPEAPVYISPAAFSGCFNASGKYIGLDTSLRANPRLVFLNEMKKIGCAELWPCFDELPYALDAAGLSIKEEGRLRPDLFLHEQYLLINEGGRRVLFSGCSHRGILNIMAFFKPDVLIGGFHFMKEPIIEGESPRLDEAAGILSGYDCRYYTCHCTGLPQYDYLKERMGDKLSYISAGQSISI